ncbi:50S ribosomal protein L25 [Fundicoccus culcitae]|uniref:Large ribosomal subunit protein bL25 n=1 Tax=Fundicoccus culcitae TaxID=2969821 RepID=A0ABY5P5C4_9LACT|nr:50S ribosomal protein L25 [Fundicoccus culcitae]UUX33953.1 50S ribosomal protein L25 [Fundicoccus culcitae]
MSLNAELRTATGSSASRHARKEGKIPTSLYGKTVEPVSLLINRADFEALLKAEGINAVFDLNYDNKVQKVWIKSYERASLKDEVYSLDLEAISADQKLTVEIPLRLVNPETVQEGIVELVVNAVTVETTPDDIPSHFEYDVTGMVIGDTRVVSDLEVPAGVVVLDDPEMTIITVSAPTEEPVETDEEEAEPEVIGEADAE